jgi:hypothetical protein
MPWKASGLSCGVGCARIGAFRKRNSRSTSVASSLCTTSESEAKRCLVRSLSYWSQTTLASNMRQAINNTAAVVLSCALWVAVVIMGLLLHGETFQGMEKKRTNSGPLRKSTSKHSIYPLDGCMGNVVSHPTLVNNLLAARCNRR